MIRTIVYGTVTAVLWRHAMRVDTPRQSFTTATVLGPAVLAGVTVAAAQMGGLLAQTSVDASPLACTQENTQVRVCLHPGLGPLAPQARQIVAQVAAVANTLIPTPTVFIHDDLHPGIVGEDRNGRAVSIVVPTTGTALDEDGLALSTASAALGVDTCTNPEGPPFLLAAAITSIAGFNPNPWIDPDDLRTVEQITQSWTDTAPALKAAIDTGGVCGLSLQ